MTTRVRLTASPADAHVTADAATRRISGRLVPYGVAATPAVGPRVEFAPGSLTVADGLWLNREHDDAAVIGRLVDHRDTDGALLVEFSVLDTTAGSDALVEAAAGARAGLSVEADLDDYTDTGEHLLVTAATVTGAALVRRPAFPDAGVTDVAAASPTMEDPVPDTATVDAPEVEATASAPAPAPILYAASITPAAPASLPNAGEWLHASLGRDRDPARYAALRDRVLATAPDTILSDVPGVIPTPIVGEAVSARAVDRPLFSAFGPLAGPAGSTFERPVITDPLADAASGTELTAMTDTLGVEPHSVAYTFVKRAAKLSAESVLYSSPDLLNIVTADLVRAYARGTEKVAAAALTAAGGTPASIAKGEEVADLYTYAAAMYGTVGVLPDVLAVAPDVWAHLGGILASDGRPLFPVMGPSNAAGEAAGAAAFAMNALGLRVIVSYGLGTGVARLVASPLVESYEAHRVSMQAQAPTVVGYEFAIGGAAATTVLVAGAVKALTFATTLAAKPTK